jgi:hypothetical protein
MVSRAAAFFKSRVGMRQPPGQNSLQGGAELGAHEHDWPVR